MSKKAEPVNCLYCGKEIENPRSNKFFHDANCRVKYYHWQQEKERIQEADIIFENLYKSDVVLLPVFEFYQSLLPAAKCAVLRSLGFKWFGTHWAMVNPGARDVNPVYKIVKP